MRNPWNCTAVCVIVPLMVVSALALPARVDQPYMKASLEHLKLAEQSLVKAKVDKAGHRAKALAFTRKAITAVTKGIAWGESHPERADIGILPEGTTVASAQPNMEAAKVSLQSALDNLSKSTPNKGGFREDAIILVKVALAEVEDAIAMYRKT
jgi:hypothetical protein